MLGCVEVSAKVRTEVESQLETEQIQEHPEEVYNQLKLALDKMLRTKRLQAS